MVTVKCYGSEKKYETLAEAIKFFKTACLCSEGSEQRTYTNILCQLLDGCTYCTDEEY